MQYIPFKKEYIGIAELVSSNKYNYDKDRCCDKEINAEDKKCVLQKSDRCPTSLTPGGLKGPLMSRNGSSGQYGSFCVWQVMTGAIKLVNNLSR